MRAIGVVLILLSMTFVSCTTYKKIEINKDRSAFVTSTQDLFDRKKLADYYQSGLITEYKDDTVKTYMVSFKIKDIDSLGNYLAPHLEKGYFQFKLKGNSLFITSGNGKKYIGPTVLCCHISIDISFEQKINSVIINGRNKNQRNKLIRISSSARQLKKNKKNINLVVDLKE